MACMLKLTLLALAITAMAKHCHASTEPKSPPSQKNGNPEESGKNAFLMFWETTQDAWKFSSTDSMYHECYGQGRVAINDSGIYLIEFYFYINQMVYDEVALWKVGAGNSTYADNPYGRDIQSLVYHDPSYKCGVIERKQLWTHIQGSKEAEGLSCETVDNRYLCESITFHELVVSDDLVTSVPTDCQQQYKHFIIKDLQEKKNDKKQYTHNCKLKKENVAREQH
uniref:Lipocalin n=1 Tax=Rhipicephalus appendiculatus TaxID=34631 RepID=A0A131YHD2_RHIAP